MAAAREENDTPEAFLQRLKLFLQGTLLHQSNDALHKSKPKAATAQSQGPVQSSSVLACKSAEGQVLVTTMRQILEEKLPPTMGIMPRMQMRASRKHKPLDVGVSATPGLPSTQSQG